MIPSYFEQQRLVLRPGTAVDLAQVPCLEPNDFEQAVRFLDKPEHIHCLSYYGVPQGDRLAMFCALADDHTGQIYLLRREIDYARTGDGPLGPAHPLPSITKRIPAFHIFEREIQENFGVTFEQHPWPKPVRYAFDRADRQAVINNYPFYKIGGGELHEVGVGPIHAGVIEPGHFRFLCNGETVLHLEIQLGWQHRGVERLFLEKPSLLQRSILAESIAGDTAVGHALAFAQTMETLAGIEVGRDLELERSIALELERMAIHTGDLGALCVDIAYQLGAAVFGALRTPLINYTQSWCGNRFGKGLVRVGGTHYPLTEALKQQLETLLVDFEGRFSHMAERAFGLASFQKRFQGIGKITRRQAERIGAVGMSARMAGLRRDLRATHPFAGYKHEPLEPILLSSGDVWARAAIRWKEVLQSIDHIRLMLRQHQPSTAKPRTEASLMPNHWACGLSEGWRGEIFHAALTDATGKIAHYKVKDPSMHNWKALELSLRDLEISDFPINNKSYDLSYCGFDL